ncbi:hypothetical protein BGP_5857 [Beggiatoa sp. PS]|nr:hypothetical protein BGP_5857 [Beggiatoa sp. PS]
MSLSNHVEGDPGYIQVISAILNTLINFQNLEGFTLKFFSLGYRFIIFANINS